MSTKWRRFEVIADALDRTADAVVEQSEHRGALQYAHAALCGQLLLGIIRPSACGLAVDLSG